MQLGDAILVATSRPDQLDRLRPHLPDLIGAVLPVIASEDSILSYLAENSGAKLAVRAESKVKASLSSRNWGRGSIARSFWLLGVALTLLGALIVTPTWTLSVLVLLAAAALLLSTGMKTAAVVAQIAPKGPVTKSMHVDGPTPVRLPRMSIMVPLSRKGDRAGSDSAPVAAHVPQGAAGRCIGARGTR